MTKNATKSVVRKGQIKASPAKDKPEAVKVPAAVRKAAGAIMDILKEAALATVELKAELAAIGEKRQGAYSLYVKAGIAAKTPEVLEEASQQLFKVIRETGAIDGHGLGCKASKDGASWQIPSAISAAKSYVMSAMTQHVPLVDEEGEARSFKAIREDVMEIARKKRMEEATDIDKMRAAIHAQLELTAEAVNDKEANIKDLADLLGRLQATYRDYGYTEEGPQDMAKADALQELVGNGNGRSRKAATESAQAA